MSQVYTCSICSYAFCQFRYNIEGENFPFQLLRNTVHEGLKDCTTCKEHEDGSAFILRNGFYYNVYCSYPDIYIYIDDEEHNVLLPPYKDEKNDKEYVYGEKIICFLCVDKKKIKNDYEVLKEKPRLFENIRNKLCQKIKKNTTIELKETCVSFMLNNYKYQQKENKYDEIIYSLTDGQINLTCDDIDISLNNDMTINELQKIDSLQSEELFSFIKEQSAKLINRYPKEVLNLNAFKNFDDVVDILLPYIIKNNTNIYKHYPYLRWSDVVCLLFSCFLTQEFSEIKYTNDVKTYLQKIAPYTIEDKENYSEKEKSIQKEADDDITLPFIVMLYKGKDNI
jgi:hypothetical protein